MVPRPPLDELLALFRATVAAEGVTTGAGAGAGTSIIDAGLALSGANSFFSMLMVVYPGQPRLVDSMDITGFVNGTGEVIFDRAYKGVAAPIPAGVPYKIVTFRFVPAEVAAIDAKLGAFTAVENLKAILGAYTAAAPLKTAIDTIAGYLDTEIAAILADTNELQTDWTNGGRLDLLLDAVKLQTDKVANLEHEVEWSSIPVVEQVASVAATSLTAGSIIPTFPTGATRVRALLVANIHAANFSAATHHITLKVQGKKNAGAYGDLIDLTAFTPIGLVNLDGAGDGLCASVDVTALVDASGSTYMFKFIVDSDNAGAVNYASSFVLVLVYRI